MTLRLGLLSTADINRKLLGGARVAEGVEVVAVASRDRERAEAFAAEHGLGRAHGSYEALLADPEVDAVYVPLPNSLHVPWSIRALQAGKHVLSEKPLTRRPEEAQAAFDAADRAGRVLAEAFMWRHHPQARRLRELLRENAVGQMRLIRAAFSFDIFARPDRADDVRLAGRARRRRADGRRLLLRERAAAARRASPSGSAAARSLRDGVDVRFAGTLALPGGVLGAFDCGLDMIDRSRARGGRDAGSIFLAGPVALARARGSSCAGPAGPRSMRSPPADPYACELEDFAAAVRGERPHPFGRDDAVGQARTIDALYRVGGVRRRRGALSEPATVTRAVTRRPAAARASGRSSTPASSCSCATGARSC